MTDFSLHPPAPGTLYVVATPLGNRADLSPRALHILTHCDIIACEDTRVTRRLLPSDAERVQLVPYHEHNERRQSERLLEALQSGRSVALATDAGTPGISDPGFRLVRACRLHQVPVSPVPGPCAVTTLLSVSGLPTNTFFFVGFLPPKTAARRRFLEQHNTFGHTLGLYESGHRIDAFLTEIQEICGAERVIALGREMTKLHESIHVGTVAQVSPKIMQGSHKGEFTMLIAPGSFALEPARDPSQSA